MRGEGSAIKTENRFHILFTEHSGVSPNALARQFPALRVSVELVPAQASELLSLLAETPVDGILVGEEDFDLAASVSSQSLCSVLLLAERNRLPDLYPPCIAAGVLAGDRARPEECLPVLLAQCRRLQAIRLREHSLQRKLDDTRLVNRAKLLLMSRLQMTEAQAHRYIEKTAMDSGTARREVAVSIIRTYEE